MKGLTAGLGAYGGAGLAGSLAGMAPQAAEEASKLLAQSPEVLGPQEFAANAGVKPPVAGYQYTDPTLYPPNVQIPTQPSVAPVSTYDAGWAADQARQFEVGPPAPSAPNATVADPYAYDGNEELFRNQRNNERLMLGRAISDAPYPTPTQGASYIDRLSAGTAEAIKDPIAFAKAHPSAAMSAVAPLAVSGLQALAKPNTLTGIAGGTASKGNIRPYQYTSGTVNPNFGKPGESYFLNQGYAALPVYAAAQGGPVPSPNDNAMYPMSNLASGKAGYNVQSSPTANEVVGGYDARIDPFTGQQMMAAGGQVSKDAEKIYSDDPGMGPYSDSTGAGPYSDTQGVGPYSSTDQTRGLEAQFKKMSPSALARYKKAKNAAMQAAAVKEEYSRASTVPDYDDTEIKMAGGGVLSQLGIGGSGGEYTGGETGPNSLLSKILSPAGRPSNIHEYGYNQGDQSYTDYGYDVLDENGNPVLRNMAMGGIASLPEYAAGGKLLRGAGDGMSDDIPAVIKGKTNQRAALADGEFVIPADVVSHLGNGSTEAGAKRLYGMMDKVREARTGSRKQGKQIKAEKYMPA